MRHKTVVQTRNFLFVIAGFITLVTAGSLYWNLNSARFRYLQLAGVLGRSFFQAIEATRDWNTHHGGVYVPITKEVRPNTLLADALREVTTREGVRLTKVNHAQMVREVSNFLREERGVRVRITSLTPLQPANVPDGWEQSALREFQRGRSEIFEVMGSGNRAVCRFMSPMKVESSCVACHPEHKDRPEDIRGGVSVTFSWMPFQQLLDQSHRQLWTVHMLFLAVSYTLIFLLGRKLIENIDALQDSLQHIRTLEGLVPICANCKKIRNEGANPFDQSSWTSIEKYITDRTDAEFTHGLCPECAKALYPGVDPGR